MSTELFEMLRNDLNDAYRKAERLDIDVYTKQAEKGLQEAMAKAPKTKLLEALKKPNRDMYKFFKVPNWSDSYYEDVRRIKEKFNPLFEQLEQKKREFLLGQVNGDLQTFAREFLEQLKELK